MINSVTNVLRDVVANEDEWIKGGAEEDRQGKLTGPQKDREVFRLELQKNQLSKGSLL